MAANINGPALSSLLFSFVTESGDQEGFLLGSLVNHVQDNISDSQISNYQVETKLYMQSYFPWPSSPRLYSNTGSIDPSAIAELLKERQKEVIGWYRFRRNSSLRVSMRESSLHQSLLHRLSLSVADHAHFLFLLCSSSASTNLAVHNLDHTFLVLSGGKFVKLPAKVVNLGETLNSDYRLQPSAGVSSSSLTIQSVLKEFQKDFEDEDGEMLEVKRIHNLSNSLHNQLKGLARGLVEGDRKREQLEEEVRGLAARVRHLQERKMSPNHLPLLPLPPRGASVPGGVARQGTSASADLQTLAAPSQSLLLLQPSPSNGGASQAYPAPRGADPAPEDAPILETPSPMEVDSMSEKASPEQAHASMEEGSRNGGANDEEESSSSSSKDHFAFVTTLLSKEKQQPGGGARKDSQRLTTRSAKRGGAGSGRGAAGTVKDTVRRSSCSPELLPGRDDSASSDSSASHASAGPGRGQGSGPRSRSNDPNSVRSRPTRVRSSSRSSERKTARNISPKVADAKSRKPNTDSFSKSTKEERNDSLQPSNSPIF